MPNRVTNALRRVVVSLGTPAIVRHDSSPLPRAATLNSRDIARSEPTPPRTESHAIAEGNLHSIDSVSMQTTNKCIPLNADSYTTGNSGQGNSRAARHTLFGLKCSSFTCDSPNCIVVYCSRSSRSSLSYFQPLSVGGFRDRLPPSCDISAFISFCHLLLLEVCAVILPGLSSTQNNLHSP